MVFHVDRRDEFCLNWQLLDIPAPADPCLPKGPSATAYFAFLQATNRVYCHFNKFSFELYL